MRQLLCFAVAGLLCGCRAPEPVAKAGSSPAPPPDVAASSRLKAKGSQTVTGTSASGESVSVKIMSADNLAQYGVPVYPGAVIDPADRAVYIKTTEKGVETLMTLDAPASAHAVAQFYRAKTVGKWLQSGASQSFAGQLPSGEKLTLTISPIAGGKTKIALSALKER